MLIKIDQKTGRDPNRTRYTYTKEEIRNKGLVLSAVELNTATICEFKVCLSLDTFMFYIH